MYTRLKSTDTWRAVNKQTEHAIDAREIFALLGL